MRSLTLAALLLAGCGLPLFPAPESDCAKAGARLGALGCPEAKTPRGASFAEACEAAADDGRDWRPDCIALVTECSQVAAAYRTPKGAACSRE